MTDANAQSLPFLQEYGNQYLSSGSNTHFHLDKMNCDCLTDTVYWSALKKTGLLRTFYFLTMELLTLGGFFYAVQVAPEYLQPAHSLGILYAIVRCYQAIPDARYIDARKKAATNLAKLQQRRERVRIVTRMLRLALLVFALVLIYKTDQNAQQGLMEAQQGLMEAQQGLMEAQQGLMEALTDRMDILQCAYCTTFFRQKTGDCVLTCVKHLGAPLIDHVVPRAWCGNQ